MPKVIEQDGVKIFIYTRDHIPKHVHCFVGGEEVIINLETLEIRQTYANTRNTRRSLELVESNRGFLLEEWDRIGPIA